MSSFSSSFPFPSLTSKLLPHSPHHLDALDKLKLPRLEAINLHLAEQEAKASTATVVEPEKTPDKPRRRRGGARARRACEKAATVIAGAA